MRSLDAWLEYISNISNKSMDLGLERITTVAKFLQVSQLAVPVITVAGTNGKGSTIAIMEAILLAQGLQVGATTSPHLYSFNERIRINGVNISDDDCCEAFAAVEQTRGNILLTYFEFVILAALVAFKNMQVDVVLLEVGLGGRLDAVNCVANDIAIITSIAIDHVEYLGDTIEQIAVEKAGIFNSNAIAVCGASNVSEIISKCAIKNNTKLMQINQDFNYKINDNNTWSLEPYFENLPMTKLKIQNAATAITALLQLQDINITKDFIARGLKKVFLSGRFEIKVDSKSGVETILDVAHNVAAVELLAANLQKRACQGKTLLVFGILNTKDSVGIIQAISSIASDGWYCASLDSANTISGDFLAEQVRQQNNASCVQAFATILDALQAANNAGKPGDRIVVFGSFYAVAGCGSQEG
ncbi:MAG: bifunctional tetrahydrofolate synthase/dihydrofolate synthase [Thiotrichales bacterium]|nr:MAG: bifunctional tetrahydrofolate synthase/dihydrofolate synthase [Thiotrichales bacterium]